MKHVEDRTFTLRLEFRQSFPADYEGDDDGFAWTEALPAVTADVVRAALGALARHPSWTVHPANRGRSAQDEVTLVCEAVR